MGKKLLFNSDGSAWLYSEESKLSERDNHVLLVIYAELANLLAKVIGTVDPAVAAMLAYVRDDILFENNRDYLRVCRHSFEVKEGGSEEIVAAMLVSMLSYRVAISRALSRWNKFSINVVSGGVASGGNSVNCTLLPPAADAKP